MKKWLIPLCIAGATLLATQFLLPSTQTSGTTNTTTTASEDPTAVMVGKITDILSREEKKYDYDSDGDGANDADITTKMVVAIESGADKGQSAPLTLIQSQKEENALHIKKGQRIIISKETPPDAPTRYNFVDLYRLNTLMILIAFFALCVFACAGYRGLASFGGLVVSMGIIFFIIIPNILAGHSPMLVTGIGGTFIATISLFLAHGRTRRTVIACISTVFSILMALILSYAVVKALRLSGVGTEEAFFLQFAPSISINMQGLLLSGILLGVLGVLDDITTAQAAVVEEVHRANPSLSFSELIARGTSVGREHIVSLVNTLVLAYTGAALPLLLLFFVYQRPWWIVLNSDMLMEEMARTLVGSIVLVLAVPLTTALAAWSYSRRPIDPNAPATHTH